MYIIILDLKKEELDLLRALIDCEYHPMYSPIIQKINEAIKDAEANK